MDVMMHVDGVGGWVGTHFAAEERHSPDGIVGVNAFVISDGL